MVAAQTKTQAHETTPVLEPVVLIRGVQPAELDRVWPKVEPLLAAAIRDGGARMLAAVQALSAKVERLEAQGTN